VNPDVELSSGEPVLALARVLERVRSAAVVAPRLLGDDGEVQPNARLFPSLAAMIGSTAPGQAIPLLRRRYERYVAPSYADHPRTVDWAIGAAMLIRRDAFDAVGGWDEGFFLYMEDTDFCRSCLRAGWDVVYVPDVSLHHRYPRASSTATSLATSRARRSHFAGMARLWRRDPRLMLGLGRGPARRIDVSGAER
jgi:N-acetylglucosaminyl-diphospho-decaprenol L-rhamnosyltransferase